MDNIKHIMTYITTDGQVFTNQDMAIRHQEELEFKTTYRKNIDNFCLIMGIRNDEIRKKFYDNINLLYKFSKNVIDICEKYNKH